MSKPSNEDLLKWLHRKIASAEQSLSARIQAEETWRSGSNKSWRQVGCTLGQKQRAERASRENRIAERIRTDIENLRAICEILE